MILKSFDEVILQPFGCLVRDIILAVYSESVEEIYVIGDKNNIKPVITKDELLLKIEKSGVSKEALKTIEYINVVGDNLLDWLIGPISVDEKIKKNIELIRSHPLVPKSVSVNGIIVNIETGEFEVVT